MNTLNKTAEKAAQNLAAQSSVTSDIIDAKHITQSFTSDSGTTQHVLHDISFTLREGEIVAILGRSGAGKSTFLRTMAGLIQPTEGTVTYRGRELTGPNPGVAIVFQTFALMPWLTVQDNVELGLRARGVSKEKRTELALAAIDAIGLDGRQEVLKLWSSEERDIKSVVIVTHNIEEAVQMADRVVVLGSHPGHLIADVQVDLPRPRDKHSAEFEAMVDNLYAILTGSMPEGESEPDNTDTTVAGDLSGADGDSQPVEQTDAEETEAAAIADMLIQKHHDAEAEAKQNEEQADAGEPKPEPVAVHLLPNATPGGMAGLLDVISEEPDGIDLADLAADLSFEIDDLFPLVDAGTMLNLLTAENGHITITPAGQEWHNADILHSKQVFARLAIEHAPLVHAIDQALSRNRNGKLRGELILDLLRSKHTDALARQQFDIAISWGRYGELFDYDADDDELTRTVDTAPLNGVAR